MSFPFRRYNFCVFFAEVGTYCVWAYIDASKQFCIIHLTASYMQFSVAVDQLWVEGCTSFLVMYIFISV